ncbi:MAG: glycosyltransferase [Parcubacteria group bacterium]|jgi:glycosyltransferase involved in cell wall biosynthesis
MRILQVHKYFTRKRGGGSVTAFFELLKMFSQRSHEVIVFSMQDRDNEPSPYAKYFTEHFDLNEKTGLGEKLKRASKFLYNFEAKRKLEELIIAEKPEIAHLHNIYHYLSPAIIDTLKKHNIPIVMTLHAYKEICPNYKLFVKGKLCERCKGGKYYHCLANRCLKDSFSGSFLAMLEAYLHKFLGSYAKVDRFISPSEFVKKKYVEFGVPAEKIVVIRNPIEIGQIKKEMDNSLAEKNFFLYYGRISEEKGIADLIRAVAKLEKEGALGENELRIVGKGSQEQALKKLVKDLELEGKVRFIGFKSGKELIDLVSQAKFIVVPSIWYDNSPMVVTEAQIARRPVIVSDLGGTSESIIAHETGFVFEAGNVDDLAGKIKKTLRLSKAERFSMGQYGYENILKINDEEMLYWEMISLYESLLR